MAEEETHSIVDQMAQALLRRGMKLVTAESCTGGWVAKVVTDAPGSSEWFDRGFVTYSNEAKQEMLGVRPETLVEHGAVSEAVVAEMARGALERSSADVSLAVSGIAGPGGATETKPVGMVCFGWSSAGRGTITRVEYFNGDRESIRRAAVLAALRGVIDQVSDE